ncbi:DUF1640 domain-containing protein [Pseudoduganella violacea]|uniref:Tetrahydromethanopterin S-methyltransferase subunit G n=1 Tax=Pseudoduganella violacea TaxID=1715466 RepID=A0A7W5B7I7_9BURK|nr:DUF1640 domain-containing protein [Pseudoduganella violacea]MBB3118004.1 tetrahydromethanopterin S-methyltransferase subunit G [Pseudoduganella violacea]
MSAADFDSHNYSKRLVAVGFSAEQANLQAEVTGEVMKEVAVLSQAVEAQQDKGRDQRQWLEATVNQAVRILNDKIDRVASELNVKIDRVASELNAKIDRVAAELDAKIDRVAAELDAKIDCVATELDAKIDRIAAELNAKIEQVAAELDAKIDRVAAELNAKIDCVAAELRQELGEKIEAAKWSNIRWTLAIVSTVCSIQTGVVLAVLRYAH